MVVSPQSLDVGAPSIQYIAFNTYGLNKNQTCFNIYSWASEGGTRVPCPPLDFEIFFADKGCFPSFEREKLNSSFLPLLEKFRENSLVAPPPEKNLSDAHAYIQKSLFLQHQQKCTGDRLKHLLYLKLGK